jgi:hypothetical protein
MVYHLWESTSSLIHGNLVTHRFERVAACHRAQPSSYQRKRDLEKAKSLTARQLFLISVLCTCYYEGGLTLAYNILDPK